MLQAMELQRVGHNLVTEQQKHSESVSVSKEGTSYDEWEEIFIDHSLDAQCDCLLS